MASAVTECGNIRIITQVVHQLSPQSADVAATSMLGSTSTVSQMMPPEIKNVNTLPKALGVKTSSIFWVIACGNGEKKAYLAVPSSWNSGNQHDCSLLCPQKLAYGLNSIFIILSLLEISIAITALVTGYKSLRQQLYQWMIL
ncbi:hypothetical protein JD844_022116 [Phrynosoma platyrhinos]|uniref:Uncharacterized protein n=1 Tax=Phrynosoma platyrhinos TaxID=52577 RepID=A0ABQ7SUN2_PHRPL|nr:hypothetical protein JD844_022116 [Phrynosoma platyrhinos]